MAKQSWDELIESFLNTENHKASFKAAKSIAKQADRCHLPQLYTLLQHDNFFVREVVGEILARLDGVQSLEMLFAALQKGEMQGHDNNGLTQSIIGVLESDKRACVPTLLSKLKSSDSSVRMDGVWGLGYVLSEADASVLFEVASNDDDKAIRATAAESLQALLMPVEKFRVKPGTLDAFKGKWMWQDCEPELHYGFDVSGWTGTCIKSNSAMFSIGDVILKVQQSIDNVFIGHQVFTNGYWYPVTGVCQEEQLNMYGGGLNWIMEHVID